MPLLVCEHHYINGEWVEPVCAGKYLDVIDPDTTEVFARVPEGGVEDVDRAVAAAQAALPKWSQTALAERKAAVERILEKWHGKRKECIHLLQRELGCTEKFAEEVQVKWGDLHFDVSLAQVDSIPFQEKTPMGGLVLREPIGVVACITPWNYPLNQATCKIVPAMLVGCTVILKPSQVTPLCLNLLAGAIHESGLPKGVFNLVHGKGSVIGDALAKHPAVDLVSFTGSTQAGRRIMELSAQSNLKVVRTELGGKSAVLMLEDADFEALIPEFVGYLMNNTGQSCNALSRLLLPQSRYEEGVDIAKRVAEATVVGRPGDPNATIGPVSSRSQWEKVQGYIKKGIEEGARLVCGGPGKPEGLQGGYYVRPTVFAHVHNNMAIAQEEIFGPVMCVIPYSTEQEGIAIANDTIFGLNNAVGSADPERALAVARQLRSGMVMINSAQWAPDGPFGGYKQSGNAREWGRSGLEEFLVTKHIAGKPPESVLSTL